MLVKIITSIAGIEAGRIVSVSNERGNGWIQRGFAQAAGPEEKEKSKVTTTVEPVILETPKQEVRKPKQEAKNTFTPTGALRRAGRATRR
jgi:hypothetical protein